MKLTVNQIKEYLASQISSEYAQATGTLSEIERKAAFKSSSAEIAGLSTALIVHDAKNTALQRTLDWIRYMESH